jgi:hypothetical protein
MNKKANDEKPPFYVLILLLHKEAKLLPIQMKLVLVTSGIPLINKKYWKLKSVISMRLVSKVERVGSGASCPASDQSCQRFCSCYVLK